LHGHSTSFLLSLLSSGNLLISSFYAASLFCTLQFFTGFEEKQALAQIWQKINFNF